MMLAVAALSVLTSTLLTVRERFRDIASLKAAGMTPSQVVAGVVAAVSGLSLAGLAIGLPLGFLVNRQVMSFVGSESDAGPGLVADPGALWLLALCAAILALGAVSALLPARAGARISVSAALRYE
jgi:ABC-type antimicrobial peptide transport system permease subunit